MTIAGAIALTSASAFLRPISSGALPAVPHEFVTAAPPVVDDLVIQSLGYVVFDWSAADGGVPGFEALPGNSRLAAN